MIKKHFVSSAKRETSTDGEDTDEGTGTGKPVQNFIRHPKLMEFVKEEFVVNGIKGSLKIATFADDRKI
jgi:hypothetical protein